MLPHLMDGLIKDESGATAIEYGLVVALIAVAMIAALQNVATSTTQMWNRVETESVGAMTGGGA